MFQSSAIPTEYGEANQVSDPHTTQLAEQLRSMHEIPTQPSYNRSYILGGGIADIDYNVGFKQAFVGNQVEILTTRFEAPNVPVTQLSYSQSIKNSANPLPVQSNNAYNLRSPGINEGF